MTETHTELGSRLAQHHKILEFDHCTHWMGIEPIDVRPGYAEIEMTPRKEMLNGFGITQGGMLFTFADVAFAMACNAPEGSDSSYTVAQGVDVNFLKPGLPDFPLRAVARVISQSGRSGLYDITVTQERPGGAKETVLEFRGRSRTVNAAPPTVR